MTSPAEGKKGRSCIMGIGIYMPAWNMKSFVCRSCECNTCLSCLSFFLRGTRLIVTYLGMVCLPWLKSIKLVGSANRADECSHRALPRHLTGMGLSWWTWHELDRMPNMWRYRSETKRTWTTSWPAQPACFWLNLPRVALLTQILSTRCDCVTWGSRYTNTVHKST